MSDLNVTSASLTVVENSKATAIAIAAPTDVTHADSALTVAVNELPTDGVVLLADGVTPVTLGETLTVAQLTGLTFRPTTNAANLSSQFAFTVSDPAGNTASGAATLAIAPSSSGNTPSAAAATVPAAPAAGPRSTPGDYNSVFGKALNIAVPSEAPSRSVTVQVTELPTNGTVVLSDGRTPVRVGQSLTPAQAAGLRFKPNGVAQSSHFDFAEVIPGRPHTPKTINLPFDSKTKTITPRRRSAQQNRIPRHRLRRQRRIHCEPIGTAQPDPTAKPTATYSTGSHCGADRHGNAGSTAAPTATATPDPTAAPTATATPDPVARPPAASDPTSTATPTLTSNTSLVATATQPAVSNGATPTTMLSSACRSISTSRVRPLPRLSAGHAACRRMARWSCRMGAPRSVSVKA